MKINPYKLAWLLIGLIILAGIIGIFYYFGTKPSPYEVSESQGVPGERQTEMPGKIVKKSPEVDISEYEEKFGDITPSPQDESLLDFDAPLAGSAIKAPDEPALPPQEEDIVKVTILDGKLEPSEVSVYKKEPVILDVESKKGDYIFYIEGIGIAEVIKEGKQMTISFRAPDKAAVLRYWCEDYETREFGSEGEMRVE